MIDTFAPAFIAKS